MAIDKLKIGMEVSSNGSTEKEIKHAKALKAAYDDAGASAAKIGGTAGSRAVAAKAAPTGYQLASSASTSSMSGTQYNVAKGVGGTSARDFADEARGLGGLVRAYATFAANLFAVGAAFTALKDAAQTDNLIRGLDTLGAASGKSLGSLSKRLVEATDGAISLRDAMTATAQASSAGMSGKNLERLAVVAKNASTALGVSMTDALSRLSRGITKLEPELLDELGLFTKIGPATEKYALQIGKSVSQLTDFERRQAFANAVLEEGELKFNSLSSSSANAYDKLLSTAKNATQQILSSVNTILEPIASFLANNPVIVAAGTIGIASTLLKRAIPDLLGDYSKLQAANEKALENQNKSLAGSKKLQAELLAEKLAAEDLAKSASKLADARLSQADAADAAAAAAKIKQSKSRATKLDEILGNTPYEDVSKEQIAALEEQSKKFEGKNKKAAESYASLAKSITEYQAALSRENMAQEALATSSNKLAEAQSRLKVIESDIAATQAALQLSNAKLAASNILQERGILGLYSAIKTLNTELKSLGATGMQRFSEIAKFTGGALLGGLGKLLTGLNWATAAWTGLTLVLDLGSAIFSKNAKEMEAFSKALQTASDSADNVSRTIDALNKKGGFSSGTIEGVSAMSNSFTELADAASAAVDAASKAQKSLDLSWWDKLSNNINKIIGKDIASKEANTLGSQIENAAKIMGRVSGGTEASSKLKSMLGVTSLDAKTASDAFKKLDEVSKGKVVEFLKEFGSELGNTSQRLNTFKSSTDNAYKAYQEFIQSTALNNPLLKLGQTLESVGKSMSDLFSLGGEQEILSAMDELVKNSEKAVLFGPKFVAGLVGIRASFKETTKEVKGVQDALADSTLELDKQQKIAEKFEVYYKRPELFLQKPQELDKAEKEIARIQEQRRELNKAVNTGADKYDRVFKQATDLFTQGLNDAFETGAKNIVTALGNVQEKAALALARAQAGGLSGENQAQKLAALNQQDLKIQERAIDTNIKLIASQEQLTATINEANALTAQANLPQDASQKAKDNAASALAAAQAYKKFVYTKDIDTSQGGITTFANTNQLDEFASALFKSMALSFSSKLAGQQAAKIEVKGKAAAQAETDRQAVESGRYADLAKVNQQEQQILAAKLQQKAVLDSIAGITSQEILLSQQKLDIDALDKRQALELEDIKSRIAKAGSDKTELDKLTEEEKRVKERQKIEKDTLGLQNRQKLLTSELDGINKQYEVTKSNSELEKTTALAGLDYSSQNLALVSSAYDINKQYVISKQAQLDKEKALVETTAAMQQAQDTLNQKREDAEARIAELGGDRESKRAKAILEELARQELLTNNTIAGLSAQYNYKIALLDKTKEINLEQERYNELLDNASSLAAQLSKSFGEVGTKLGAVATSFAKMAVSSEKNAKAQEKLQDDLVKAKGTKAEAAAQAALDKQKRKAAKDDLDNISEAAGATKQFFKEKTAGYKLMSAVEQTTAAISMAIKVQDMAVTLSTLPGKIAGGVAQLFNQGGFAGFAGAAAFLAIMAGLGFSSGKSASAPAGFTAAEQQKVQGTGVKYNAAGNLVESRGGVTGDVTAVANSVKTSIDELSKEFFGMLGSGSSRIIRALTAIEENTGNTVKAMLGKLIGLGAGSAFGTMEGSSGSGIIGSLFGKSSTTIADVGVTIKGTLDNLSKGIGDFKQYENVVRSSSSLFGLIKSTSYRTNLKDLESNIVNGFSDIFGNVSEALVASAEALEGSGKRAADLIKEIPVELKVSVKGMSGTEAADAIMSAISVELNAAALKIFPYIEQYNKIGEEMYQTVARIVKNGETVKTGLSMIGKSITGLSLEATVAAQEDLISKVGGVDKFSSGIETYFDNFFDASTKFDFRLKSLTQKFKEANVILPKSKAEYTSLVNSLDAANADQRTQLAFLINNAEAYNNLLSDQNSALSDTISKLEDSVAKFKDFAKTVRDFRDSLLLSGSSIATPTEKYVEAKTQFEATYASALAGDKDAMSKLTSISQTFLDMSKQLFASSGSYTADFNMVIQKLDEAQISALANADVEQLKLDYAKNTVDLLTTIDANIAAIAGVSAHARGGVASGLSLVGESGPELVDFTNPGRVYTAEQTAGMFTYNAGMGSGISSMVTEIRQLREEVTQLRKEQQKQTGDLIMSNYDANQKAADDISAAVVDSSSNSAWDARITAQIK